MFKFETLDIWKNSVLFTVEIYRLTKTFPKEEMFGLTSQLKRSVVSISLNIAEGSTSQSNAEFKKFLGYAIRSCAEVIACLHMGKKRRLIEEMDFHRFYGGYEEVFKMTQGLKRSLN